MVQLLRKAFIKDYQNLSDPTVRANHGVLSSIVGLVLNAILVGAKLTSAILLALASSGALSFALLGDSLNNLFDFASSLIALIGFHIAKKPADKEHPYGHGRAEYVAGMLIGAVIIASAVLLCIRSVQGAIEKQMVTYDVFAYIALGLTLPIKGIQAHVNFSLSKTLHSPTLKGVGIDASVDIALSSLLLIFALLSRAFGWTSLDNYLGIGVSLFLAYAGARVFKETSGPLLGAPMEADIEKKAEEIILAHPAVHGVHDIIFHTYGESVRYLSFHVELDGSLSLKEAHDILDELEQEVGKATNSLAVAHPDPIDVHDKRLESYKEKIASILKGFGEGLTCHDVHFKKEGEKETLVLDILLPFGIAEGAQKEIRRQLDELGIAIEVHFDHPYSE